MLFDFIYHTGQKVYLILAKKISFVETGKMQKTLSGVKEILFYTTNDCHVSQQCVPVETSFSSF